MKLALQSQRIDDGADIVDRAEAEQLDATRLRIHFHLTDHAAVGERVRARVSAAAAEANAELLRQSQPGV